METSLLFLIFKRPETTLQVFETIRQVRPSRLYVAADGARFDQAGEAEKVAKTRELVLNRIDWPCEVKTLLRESNLGCRMAVSSAIDWFFEHEEEGIILEDDCFPDLTFFNFCKELLEYYRYDTRVMAISGNNFQQGQRRGKYSYYFSQLPYCWGWATWRRAWLLYHVSIEHIEEIIEDASYRELTCYTASSKFYCEKAIKAYRKEIDSWAYLWMFATAVNHGLSILPQKNVVTNIGINSDATHTVSDNKRISIKSQSVVFPLNHPPYMSLNKEADMSDFLSLLNLSSDKRNRLIDQLQKIINSFRKVKSDFK